MGNLVFVQRKQRARSPLTGVEGEPGVKGAQHSARQGRATLLGRIPTGRVASRRACGTPRCECDRQTDVGRVLVRGRRPCLWTTAPWSPPASSSWWWKAPTVTRPHGAATGTCPSCVHSATALPVRHEQCTTGLRGERNGGVPPSRGASCQLSPAALCGRGR